MKSLLDQFKTVRVAFQPKSGIELFALRLAQKLGDAPAVAHFLQLVQEYTEFQILCAFRRTLRHSSGSSRGAHFLAELKKTNPNGYQNGIVRLISIRIERRAVAVAVLHGEHLEYTDARQLSSDRAKAIGSAIGFITWLLDRFPVESAALEAIPEAKEFHRRALHDGICETLRDRLLPIWEVPRTVLTESCGHPALKSRSELRQIATTIWPILTGKNAKVFIQDAAILGLHVQTERLFIIN